MMAAIKKISKADEIAWDNYVTKHPSGTVFHLTAWKRVVEKTFGHKAHYLTKKKNGYIKGICPIFELKSILFGHSFISIPFAELGGVLSDNENIEMDLINRACRIAESENTMNQFLF